MTLARVTRVDLHAFKSFRNASFDVRSLNILTGLNSSGKSNALEALALLHHLIIGGTIERVLDDVVHSSGRVRGGVKGLAPHGQDHLKLGCEVLLGEDRPENRYVYSVEIAPHPAARVVSETLEGVSVTAHGAQNRRALFSTQGQYEWFPNALQVEYANGFRGRDPKRPFADSRLVITQLREWLQGKGQTELSIRRGIEAVVAGLSRVFVLDPIPSRMRGYVPASPTALHPDAANLSAALTQAVKNAEVKARLVRYIRRMTAIPAKDFAFETPAGEVMFGVVTESDETLWAKELSDGLLRFLAIALTLITPDKVVSTNLPTASPGIAIDLSDSIEPTPVIIIEEIENGLHPSQASLIIELLEKTITHDSVRVMVTTHSPALLDISTGRVNDSILVTYRGDDGWSRVTRMMELSGYSDSLLRGNIGEAVSRGELTHPKDDTSARDFDLNAFLAGL